MKLHEVAPGSWVNPAQIVYLNVVRSGIDQTSENREDHILVIGISADGIQIHNLTAFFSNRLDANNAAFEIAKLAESATRTGVLGVLEQPIPEPVRTRMRAKFKVADVIKVSDVTPHTNGPEGEKTMEELHLSAVGRDDAYGPDGVNEDNDFARYTPQGDLRMIVTNPNLFGKFAAGQKYYLDFMPVE